MYLDIRNIEMTSKVDLFKEQREAGGLNEEVVGVFCLLLLLLFFVFADLNIINIISVILV